MFFKKFVCVLLVFSVLLGTFSVGVSAARTGEFETYPVEFKAIVPDDFNLPVYVQLTHNTGYVLNYPLHQINGYFLNEPVPPGEYTVNVEIADQDIDSEGYNLIFDETFLLEPSPVAATFTVIIDNASLSGDGGDIDSSNVQIENTESKEPDKDVVQNDDVSSSTENKPESNSRSIVVSIFVSVLLLVVAAIGLWFWDKHR